MTKPFKHQPELLMQRQSALPGIVLRGFSACPLVIREMKRLDSGLELLPASLYAG
jgi:hypothetical protein